MASGGLLESEPSIVVGRDYNVTNGLLASVSFCFTEAALVYTAFHFSHPELGFAQDYSRLKHFLELIQVLHVVRAK